MLTSPRVRRRVKRGLVGATAALVILWFGSAWVAGTCFFKNTVTVRVASGMVVVQRYSVTTPAASGPVSWRLTRRMRASLELWPYVGFRVAGYSSDYFALWPLVLVVGGVTVWVFRVDARLRRESPRNPCDVCGYERGEMGAAERCPECGRAAG